MANNKFDGVNLSYLITHIGDNRHIRRLDLKQSKIFYRKYMKNDEFGKVVKPVIKKSDNKPYVKDVGA